MDRIKELESVAIDINKIKLDETNPNFMTEKEYNGLKKSMEKWGFLAPIVVSKDLVIADGEHRLKVYKEYGKKTIKAYIIDFKSDAERRLFRQMANKLRGKHNIEKDIIEFKKIIEKIDKKVISEITAISEKEIDDLIKLKDYEMESYIVLKELHDIEKVEFEKVITLKLTESQRKKLIKKFGNNRNKIFKIIDGFIKWE